MRQVYTGIHHDYVGLRRWHSQIYLRQHAEQRRAAAKAAGAKRIDVTLQGDALEDYKRLKGWLDRINRVMIERGFYNKPRSSPTAGRTRYRRAGYQTRKSSRRPCGSLRARLRTTRKAAEPFSARSPVPPLPIPPWPPASARTLRSRWPSRAITAARTSRAVPGRSRLGVGSPAISGGTLARSRIDSRHEIRLHLVSPRKCAAPPRG